MCEIKHTMIKGIEKKKSFIVQNVYLHIFVQWGRQPGWVGGKYAKTAKYTPPDRSHQNKYSSYLPKY